MWLIQLTGANPTSNRNSTYWWSTLLPLQPSWYPSSRTVFTNINWVNASAWTYPKLNEPHWGLNIHWIMVHQIIEYVSRFFVNSKKTVQAKYQTESVTLEADVSPGPARTHSLLFTACKLSVVQTRSVYYCDPQNHTRKGGGQCGDNTSTRDGRGGCRVEVLIKSRFLNNLFFTWS